MIGYQTEDSGEPTHDHKKCFFWLSPYIFGWSLSVYYGCMGHCVQISKSFDDKLGRTVCSIRLPYKKV